METRDREKGGNCSTRRAPVAPVADDTVSLNKVPYTHTCTCACMQKPTAQFDESILLKAAFSKGFMQSVKELFKKEKRASNTLIESDRS